jgi:hypothetical protein
VSGQDIVLGTHQRGQGAETSRGRPVPLRRTATTWGRRGAG